MADEDLPLSVGDGAGMQVSVRLRRAFTFLQMFCQATEDPTCDGIERSVLGSDAVAARRPHGSHGTRRMRERAEHLGDGVEPIFLRGTRERLEKAGARTRVRIDEIMVMQTTADAV